MVKGESKARLGQFVEGDRAAMRYRNSLIVQLSLAKISNCCQIKYLS